jgi:hypothetical protein
MAFLKFPTPTQLQNILTPSANTDAATKGYVDEVANTIIAGDPRLEVGLIDANGAPSNTTSNVTTIRFDTESGFDVSNLGNGAVKIALNSTFKYWEIDGEPTLTAQGIDTVNFETSNGITISANGANTPQSIKFGLSETGVYANTYGGQFDIPIITVDGYGRVSNAYNISIATNVIGATGATGPTGNTGIDGTTGATGVPGPIGNTGIQGIAGTDGATGATGPAGANGSSVQIVGAVANSANLPLPYGGSIGDGYLVDDSGDLWVYTSVGTWTDVGQIKGPNGATGSTGPSGAIGPDGATGPTGNEGATGVQGATGLTGASGFNGATGATGPIGLTGSTGPMGSTGATGPKGNDGTSVKIVGHVSTSAYLPVPYAGDLGDGYITDDTGHLWVYTAVDTWTDVGTVRGPDGATGTTGATGATGARLSSYIEKTSSYTANIGDSIVANTGNGSFIITLPEYPANGSYITIQTNQYANTNPLTVALAGGKSFQGIEEDLEIDVNNIIVTFVYEGLSSDWTVAVNYGPTGATGPGGSVGPAGPVWNGGAVSNTTIFANTASFNQISESLQVITNASGTVEHNTSLGSVFYHTDIIGNFTPNFTNVPMEDNRVISATIVLQQDSPSYLPVNLQINGSAITPLWGEGVTPIGHENQVDAYLYSMIRQSNNWTVIAQTTYYG